MVTKTFFPPIQYAPSQCVHTKQEIWANEAV